MRLGSAAPIVLPERGSNMMAWTTTKYGSHFCLRSSLNPDLRSSDRVPRPKPPSTSSVSPEGWILGLDTASDRLISPSITFPTTWKTELMIRSEPAPPRTRKGEPSLRTIDGVMLLAGLFRGAGEVGRPGTTPKTRLSSFMIPPSSGVGNPEPQQHLIFSPDSNGFPFPSSPQKSLGEP